MQTFKIIGVTALLTVLSWQWSTAQKHLPASLDSIVNELAARNVYEVTATVGYAGTRSSQLKRFQELNDFATATELAQLASLHKNAVVRLYALQALKQRRLPVPPGLTVQFAKDHSIVTTLQGCIAAEKKLSEVFKGDFQAFQP